MDDVLASSKTIAIIGLSDKPDRYSHQVATYLQEEGYTIIPINPNVDTILGNQAYASIADVPADIHIDIVDIFRKSEFVPQHVDEILARGGIRAIWLQEGISHPEAEQKANDAGIQVHANMCLMKSHKT